MVAAHFDDLELCPREEPPLPDLELVAPLVLQPVERRDGEVKRLRNLASLHLRVPVSVHVPVEQLEIFAQDFPVRGPHVGAEHRLVNVPRAALVLELLVAHSPIRVPRSLLRRQIGARKVGQERVHRRGQALFLRQPHEFVRQPGADAVPDDDVRHVDEATGDDREQSFRGVLRRLGERLAHPGPAAGELHREHLRAVLAAPVQQRRRGQPPVDDRIVGVHVLGVTRVGPGDYPEPRLAFGVHELGRGASQPREPRSKRVVRRGGELGAELGGGHRRVHLAERALRPAAGEVVADVLLGPANGDRGGGGWVRAGDGRRAGVFTDRRSHQSETTSSGGGWTFSFSSASISSRLTRLTRSSLSKSTMSVTLRSGEMSSMASFRACKSAASSAVSGIVNVSVFDASPRSASSSSKKLPKKTRFLSRWLTDYV